MSGFCCGLPAQYQRHHDKVAAVTLLAVPEEARHAPACKAIVPHDRLGHAGAATLVLHVGTGAPFPAGCPAAARRGEREYGTR